MFEVGDRVICLLPYQGAPAQGSLGTVVFGGRKPCIEFDEPFSRGHAGNRDNISRGQPRHCWNFWGGIEGYLEKVDTKPLSPEERTKQKVLAKIHLLEQRFETRQKEKQNANKDLSLQAGKQISQNLGPQPGGVMPSPFAGITVHSRYW